MASDRQRVLVYLHTQKNPMYRSIEALLKNLGMSRKAVMAIIGALEREDRVYLQDGVYALTELGRQEAEQAVQAAPGLDRSPRGGFTINSEQISGGQFVQAGDDAEISYDQSERRDVHVEGGGIAAGGDLTIGEGSTVTGRDHISVGGNVGPGSVVGSGSVHADNIAGGDIRVGGARSLRASAEDIEALRAALDLLREDVADLEDARLGRRAGRRLDALEKALGLAGGPVKPGLVVERLDWLEQNIPELAGEVRALAERIKRFNI